MFIKIEIDDKLYSQYKKYCDERYLKYSKPIQHIVTEKLEKLVEENKNNK